MSAVSPKAITADEALTVIAKLGINSALVVSQRRFAFSDPPPGEKGWKIGIDASPRGLLLSNAAVSASGANEQFFTVNSVRYSHILDPKNRPWSDNKHRRTTVVARRGIDADGLASTLNVLGPQVIAFIDNQPGHPPPSLATEKGLVESTSFRALAR